MSALLAAALIVGGPVIVHLTVHGVRAWFAERRREGDQ